MEHVKAEVLGKYHSWTIKRLEDTVSNSFYFYAIYEIDEGIRSPLYSTRHLIMAWIEGRADKAPRFNGEDLRVVK